MNTGAIIIRMAEMTGKDKMKLSEIETKLNMVSNTYENLLPIFHSIHRKKLSLELEIKILDQERSEIVSKQLTFDRDLGF